MGRRSERLSKQGMLASDLAGEGDVIQVVSRAFDVLRCFEGHEARLGTEHHRQSGPGGGLRIDDDDACHGRQIPSRWSKRPKGFP